MRIKSFRLFESNERLERRIKEIRDVYEDAKSIEYILEDGGYDFNWKIDTIYQSYLIQGDISDLIRSKSFTFGVFHHDFFKPVDLRINILGKDGRRFSNDLSPNKSDDLRFVNSLGDVRRFKTLLEEHLDYLPEDSISIENSYISYKVLIKLK